MIATLHPVAAGRRLDVSSALRRDWLALQVAEAYLRLIWRTELTGEIRDEVHLLCPEGRPGRSSISGARRRGVGIAEQETDRRRDRLETR